MRSRIIFVLAFILLLVPTAQAHKYSVGDIVVDHPWSMPLPPVSKNGAAYITIENLGEEDDRLISGNSPMAETVEVHKHVHENGMMKMQRVENGLEVTAGTEVAFEPGGYHLMLIGLKKPLVEGSKFPVSLEFERAGNLEIVVQVEQNKSDDMGSKDMDHSGHKMGNMDSNSSASQTN